MSTSAAATATPPAWPREAMAGLSGAAAALATTLTMGLLAYAPAGSAAAALGLPAAFAAALAGGVVMALLGRSRLPCATPSSATTLLLAALVARLWPTRRCSPPHPPAPRRWCHCARWRCCSRACCRC
jgi:MFS superfamily sulfate permease-like transporter